MKQKNLVLMVVAVGCGLVAAFLTTQINAKPKVEMVEVLVAAKDLPVGTTLNPAELDKLVETKPLAKDVLPPQFATTKEELLGKRLSRPVLKGETFTAASLVKGQVVTLPPGKDLYSLAMNARDGAGGFVGPGSKVDILASLQLGEQLKTFPLLVDMHVVAVNQTLAYDSGRTSFADMSMISLAADQEEALLLALAEKRGCQLKLLLRRDNKPKDEKYSMAEVKKLLQDPRHPAFTRSTEDPSGGDIQPTTPAVGPAPTEKKEYVKVWVAKEDIAANTDLTADLVKTKFTEFQLPKEYSEGACTDLGQYYTKALKHGVAKGQWVTLWMLGEQQLKPSPQFDNIVNLPKPGPADPVRPEPVRDPVATTQPQLPAEYQDVAIHGASGTHIHRFMKVKGEWKLVAVLTPEQAARQLRSSAPSESKPSAAPEKQPTAPEKQPAEQPDASKGN